MSKKDVQDVLRAAEERLQTALFGLEDMSRPERAITGLYNAVVFGRMVTFALQNMSSIRPDFEAWYVEKRAALAADALMRFFHNLRTLIEKTTERPTRTTAKLNLSLPSDLERFEPAPPGATAFFIGDVNGGSGWKITRADGTVETYYVDLPPELGQVSLHLSSAPEELRDLPAAELVGRYLRFMGEVIAEARQRFAGEQS